MTVVAQHFFLFFICFLLITLCSFGIITATTHLIFQNFSQTTSSTIAIAFANTFILPTTCFLEEIKLNNRSKTEARIFTLEKGFMAHQPFLIPFHLPSGSQFNLYCRNTEDMLYKNILVNTLPESPLQISTSFDATSQLFYIYWKNPVSSLPITWYQLCDSHTCYHFDASVYPITLQAQLVKTTNQQFSLSVSNTKELWFGDAVSFSLSMEQQVQNKEFKESIRVVQKTTTSISFQWDGIGNFIYVVCLSQVNCKTTNQTQIVFDSLEPATLYAVSLSTTTLSPSDYSSFITVNTLPLPPSNIRVTRKASRSISLSWEGAYISSTNSTTPYVYRICVEGDCSLTASKSIEYSPILPNQRYVLSIKTLDQFSDFSSSSNITVISLPEVDYATCVAQVARELSCSWDYEDYPNYLPVTYQVCIYQNIDLVYCNTTTTKEWTFKQLNANLLYFALITPSTTEGQGKHYATSNICTLPNPPEINIKKLTTDLVGFAWTHVQNSDCKISYEICALTDASDIKSCQEVLGKDEIYVEKSNLRPNTNYIFQIYATNEKSQRLVSSLVNITTNPTDIQDLNIISTAYTTNIQWIHDNFNFLEYESCLYQKEYRQLITCQVTDSPFVTFSNLTESTLYIVTGQLKNPVGGMSILREFIIGTATYPPRNFSVHSITPTEVVVSWQRPLNATEDASLTYNVTMVDLNKYDCNYKEESSLLYACSGLQPANRYTMQVVAINKYGTSNPARLVFDTTPLQPSNVTLLHYNEHSLQFHWSEPIGGNLKPFLYKICLETCLETTNNFITFYDLSVSTSYNVEITTVINSTRATSDPYSYSYLTSVNPPGISVDAYADYSFVTISPISIVNTKISYRIEYQFRYKLASSQNWIVRRIISTAFPSPLYDLSFESMYNFEIQSIAIDTIFDRGGLKSFSREYPSTLVASGNFTTLRGTIPQVSPTIRIIDTSHNSILLAVDPIDSLYNGNSRIINYYINIKVASSQNEWSNENQQQSEIEIGGDGGVASLTGLSASTEYQIQCRARNGVGFSNSSSVLITTKEDTEAENLKRVNTITAISVIVIAIVFFLLICCILFLLVGIIGISIWMKRTKRKSLKIISDISDLPLIDSHFLIPYDDLSFTNSKVLGSGAQGTVCTAKYKGATVAVKMFPKQVMGMDNDLQVFFDELRFLSHHCNHINIIRLIGVAEDIPQKTLCLVTECCMGGDLASYVMTHASHIPFEQKVKWIRDVASGMSYLHSHQIVHRDLKCENILLQDATGTVVKIIDFGLSKQLSNDTTQNMTMNIGTPTYLAPEVIKMQMNISDVNFSNTPSDTWQEASQQGNSIMDTSLKEKPTLEKKLQYDIKADIYSFAIVMYVILFENRNPYGSSITNELQLMYMVHQNPNFRPKIDSKLYDTTKQGWYVELMKQCWDSNPENRPTFENIIQIIDSNSHYYS